MSFHGEVWDSLSAINVNKHTEKKGNLTYLSWAWAWGELMRLYPESSYEFLPEKVFADGSVEVNVCLEIRKGEKVVSRAMWLPVMDNRNNSITNPTSRQISDTKMRCLVKAIAMAGLGFYIYAGEDTPRDKPLKEWVEEWSDAIGIIKAGLAAQESDDNEADMMYYQAAESWWTLPGEVKQALWVAPSKNKDAPFTTREREMMKDREFREVYYGEGNE